MSEITTQGGNYVKKRSIGNTPYVGQTRKEAPGWSYQSRISWRNEHGQMFSLPNRRERRQQLFKKRPDDHFIQHVPYLVDGDGNELPGKFQNQIPDGYSIRHKVVYHHNSILRSDNP